MTMITPIETGYRDRWVRIYPPQADLVQQRHAADGAMRRRCMPSVRQTKPF